MQKTSDLIWQDTQHQVLFELIEQIKVVPFDPEILQRLKLYAEHHFTLEEAYMRVLDYPETDAHVRAHDRFREELEALKEKMNLQVIYVLSDPDEDWEGERGFITAEILKRHFPRQYQKQYQRFVYFICDPEPLMDAMEAMLPELGVPREKVFSERFGMV